MSLAQPSASMILLTLHCYFSCVQIHLTEPPPWCLALKSQRHPQIGLVRPLESFRVLPVRCVHVNTPPVLAGNQFSFLFLPPLGNVPVSGICPHVSCSHTETKKSFHFSSRLSPLKKKVLAFSPNSPVDSSIFLYFMYLKLFLFPCIIFLLHFLLKFPSLFLFGVFIFLKSPLII